MATRTFGPIRGAGVQINELSGSKSIEPAALGWVGYAGILEKGPVGELIEMLGPDDMLKKVGGRIRDSLLPDALQDFFEVAGGAGGALAVRVTDGNEARAAQTLYARRSALLTPVGTIEAHNGGRWAGKRARYSAEFALEADLTEIQLTTGIATWQRDQWKGGVLRLAEVNGRTYPIIGNTAAGVISVAIDSTMASDLAASGDPANFRYYLELENEGKVLTFEIRDGEENPTTEFGLFVYLDGDTNPANKWPNLSMDTASARYWVNMINDDPSNFEIRVTDTFTGTRTADVRPANHYGVVLTVTATLLTATIHDFTINSPVAGGNPTLALGTTTDDMEPQRITITMTSATAGNAVSDKFGALGVVTLGTPFVPEAPRFVPPFTVTAGGTPLVATDTLVINFKPFRADALIGGYVYPDKVNASKTRYRIIDNNRNSITVADGSDMTSVSATSDQFLVQAPIGLENGRDGIADLTDANYNSQAWDQNTSPFLQIANRGFGVVEFATPGITSTLVQQAGRAYAEAKNHSYTYEVTSGTLTETGADTYVNDTLGRSDYAMTYFPSYGYVQDPDGEQGKLKLVSLTGKLHGRAAAFARDFQGYHKAAAGEDAILPDIVKLTTGNRALDEEVLNPRGINVVKKVKGNFVAWGDRTLWRDSEWKFKHHRKLMSYYEQVLQESFGFIVFALNNETSRKQVKTAMNSFFLPEHRKGALDQDIEFAKACVIKIDRENNTPAVKAAGDAVCDVELALVDVIERLRIRISKAGITESKA